MPSIIGLVFVKDRLPEECVEADAMPLARLAHVVATGARLDNVRRRGYLDRMRRR